MSSRDNLLNDVKSCSFEANDVDNVCCTDADSACGNCLSIGEDIILTYL